MTIKFKIAALNALSKSYNSSDIVALSSVRNNIKAKELNVGDIVKNPLTGNFYSVASINKDSLCYLVTLDCPASVDGHTFTMNLIGDRIDIYMV